MPSYNIPSVFDFGATGNGTTDDTAAFQSALNSISNGGALLVPPGKYHLTGTLSLNIAAGASASLLGLGQEVSILDFINNSGLVVNFGSLYSSVHVRDLTIAGHQAGVGVALTIQQAQVNQNPAVSAQSDVTRVTTRGGDAYPASAYWNYGINISDVSNVTVDTHIHFGSPGGTNNSVGLQLIGHNGTDNGGPGYAVQFNVVKSSYNNCYAGIQYSSYVQGLAVSETNFTGCQLGIYAPGGASGGPAQLTVVNSQFNCSIGGIYLDTPVGGVQISNNWILVQPNSNGVKMNGTGFSIIGNFFTSGSPTGNNGVLVAAGGLGAISGNAFSGLATGVAIQSGVSNVGVNNNTYQLNGRNTNNTGTNNRIGVGQA